MKKISTIICLLFLLVTASYGQWQNKGFTHQGNPRQYRVYKSPNYNPSVPASLVLTLHGLGDNMTNFSGIGMNDVADSANIIVVVPQALSDLLAGTAWNSGAGLAGYYPNSTINDVSFISDLLDTIQANYAINPARVYACGFSMGGFMTNRLAVELNTKFTAFATVSGTFGDGLPSYHPHKAISIAHFHGTADGTVPYAGNGSGIGADSLVHFWTLNDQCNSTPAYTALPDTKSDGYTVEHYLYSNGQHNTEVEFFKVTGADHVWLTAANDISYTVEIWKFFNKHKASYSTAGLKNSGLAAGVSVFPNPSRGNIHIEYTGKNTPEKVTVTLSDLTGKELFSDQFQKDDFVLPIAELNLQKGSYLLKLKCGNEEIVKRIVVE